MSELQKHAVWLRGPIEGVPSLVQPIAHALLQAREEVNSLLKNFDENLLWSRPAGVAAAAFHLRHLAGVLDRLFTYAKGQSLTPKQLMVLQKEGQEDVSLSLSNLLNSFNKQVDYSIEALKTIDETRLTHKAYVGRARLPSTIIGLLVHAAGHTMRHTGQLHVTVKVLQS